jgi:acetoacetyl-CoA reductase
MGRVVIVTGGTTGLGRAMSLKFKNQGDTVVAGYREQGERAQSFQKETGVSVWPWDVSDCDACARFVEKVASVYGRIDVLVNNAGVTRDTLLHKMSWEAWDWVIRTNLYSVFNMCRWVVPLMCEKRFGRIINISSVNGVRGRRGQVNYSASKAGILGLSKSLAQEVATYGITVNAVAPGYSDTAMVRAVPEAVLEKIIQGIPVHRLGTPDEIAEMVSFLASDKAGFITGSTFHVNGGELMV